MTALLLALSAIAPAKEYRIEKLSAQLTLSCPDGNLSGPNGDQVINASSSPLPFGMVFFTVIENRFRYELGPDGILTIHGRKQSVAIGGPDTPPRCSSGSPEEETKAVSLRLQPGSSATLEAAFAGKCGRVHSGTSESGRGHFREILLRLRFERGSSAVELITMDRLSFRSAEECERAELP